MQDVLDIDVSAIQQELQRYTASFLLEIIGATQTTFLPEYATTKYASFTVTEGSYTLHVFVQCSDVVAPTDEDVNVRVQLFSKAAQMDGVSRKGRKPSMSIESMPKFLDFLQLSQALETLHATYGTAMYTIPADTYRITK